MCGGEKPQLQRHTRTRTRWSSRLPTYHRIVELGSHAGSDGEYWLLTHHWRHEQSQRSEPISSGLPSRDRQWTHHGAQGSDREAHLNPPHMRVPRSSKDVHARHPVPSLLFRISFPATRKVRCCSIPSPAMCGTREGLETAVNHGCFALLGENP